jgi:hypothetical protein
MIRKRVTKKRPQSVSSPSEKVNPFASAYAARLAAQVTRELSGFRPTSRPAKKPRGR